MNDADYNTQWAKAENKRLNSKIGVIDNGVGSAFAAGGTALFVYAGVAMVTREEKLSRDDQLNLGAFAFGALLCGYVAYKAFRSAQNGVRQLRDATAELLQLEKALNSDDKINERNFHGPQIQ